MSPYVLNIAFMCGCGIITAVHLMAKNYGQAWYWASAASITGAVTWGMK